MRSLGIRALRPARERRGSAVIMALLVVMAMASTAAVLMTLGSANQRDAKVRTESAQARFLAEGAVERVTTELQDLAHAGIDPPAEGTVAVVGVTVPYEIEQLTPTSQEFDADGLMSFVTTYEVTARAESGDSRAQSHRIVKVASIPVYQFALFWDSDLEIWPGPEMLVGGRVHSNSDMYVGCNDELTFDTNYVRIVGDLHQRRKHGSEVSKGDINVREWVANPFDSSEPDEFVRLETKGDFDSMGIESVSGYDSDFAGHDANGDGDFFDSGDWLPFAYGALELFDEPDFYSGGEGVTLQTGDHNVMNADLADIASIAMFEEVQPGEVGDWAWNTAAQEYVPAPGAGTHDQGPFLEQAGLAIIMKPDGSLKAYDGDGDDITDDLRSAGIVDTEELYDARQAEGDDGTILTTVVDMDLLSASPHFPANGLLYASSYGMGEGTDVKGVRLTNGAELAGPLTVVSEGSVYVHGDYNTENKKPAAVLGDAVNLLSNAWDGSKDSGDHPSAEDTTFNMAIVSGNTGSIHGSYNGGVENFPRLHENWAGRTLTISGSMVCPWTSSYATARWKIGHGFYNPPARDWFYDTDFNDPAKLPPFALMAATVTNVVSW